MKSAFRMYSVVGAMAQISAGAVLALTNEQVAPRRHRLSIIEQHDDGALCRAEHPLEFKVGEVLGLVDRPDKAQAEILVPVDGAEDGRERPAAKAKAKPARKAATPKGPAAAPPASPAGSEAATGGPAGDGAASASPATPAAEPVAQPPAAP